MRDDSEFLAPRPNLAKDRTSAVDCHLKHVPQVRRLTTRTRTVSRIKKGRLMTDRPLMCTLNGDVLFLRAFAQWDFALSAFMRRSASPFVGVGRSNFLSPAFRCVGISPFMSVPCLSIRGLLYTGRKKASILLCHFDQLGSHGSWVIHCGHWPIYSVNKA